MSDIFKKNIKQWNSLNNEIKLLNKQLKEVRNKRNEIHNDIIRYCLLYTSPSPRDLRLSRMPSSA